MEQKTVKNFLPTTYEQYLQQKKKMMKPGAYQRQLVTAPESIKENKLSTINRKSEVAGEEDF